MITVESSNRKHIASDLMPDFTPLLDVMFMLIIFLILTANAVPYAIEVNLPEDNQSVSIAVDEPDTLSIILLPHDKGWQINEDVFTHFNSFQTTLLQRYNSNKQQRIIIMGEKSVSMEKLLNVMTFLKKHNIHTADIVMERP